MNVLIRSSTVATADISVGVWANIFIVEKIKLNNQSISQFLSLSLSLSLCLSLFDSVSLS